MKIYLDEDLSPKIAVLLRRKGIDAFSAHEVGMLGASDREQLEFAAKEKRCLVTRNRDDFIQLSIKFFNDRRPHHGVLIIPYTVSGDQFTRIANLLRRFAEYHAAGLEPYVVSFLPIG